MPILAHMTPLRGSAYKAWLKQQAKRKAKIVAMHKDGISHAEIGRRIGVSRQRIYQIVEKT
jgi:transposase